jgi:hypothetical protein
MAQASLLKLAQARACGDRKCQVEICAKVPQLEKCLQAISKPAYCLACHSERSEESTNFNELRSFTSFRMTKKSVLK